MNRLAYLIIFFVLVVVSLSAGQVSAQSPASPSGLRERRENMCQRVTDKIGERRQRFEEHRDNRANIYRGVIHRLNNLVTKLEDRGCDASQIKTDLSAFEKLIDELVVAFNLFLDKLQAVGIPVCQAQPQDHRAALAAVKDQLALVREKQRAVRDFYKNTINPNVKDLKQTCREVE